MKQQRSLPADVYDALELSALAFGGIGAQLAHDTRGPRCLIGHIEFICDGLLTIDGREVEDVVARVFNGSVVQANDRAVMAINGRHGAPHYVRVPFDEWCKELNIVRGE